MRASFFLLILTIIFFSCKNNDGFVIKGKVNGAKGKTIFLNSSNINDSTKINDDNTFEFSGKIAEADFFNLYFYKTNPVLLFVDTLDKIDIETDTDNFYENCKITGSKTSEQMLTLQKMLNTTFNNVQQLYKKMMITADSTKIDSIRAVFTNMSNDIVNKHREKVFDFIKQNPSSFASLTAIYQAFDSRNPVFNYDFDSKYYNLLDSGLMAKYPNSKHTKEFHSQIVEIKQQLEREEMMSSKIKEGMEAPDFEVPSQNGTQIKLSSFRGNYVLLDFWASWCHPCRQENPNVLTAFNKFQKKGFRVFQVSLDKDKNEWLKAIQTDALWQWKHGSDLQYWNSAPAKLYAVQSIPSNFLIDPKGIIVAKNLRGQQLIDALNQIYTKK